MSLVVGLPPKACRRAVVEDGRLASAATATQPGQHPLACLAVARTCNVPEPHLLRELILHGLCDAEVGVRVAPGSVLDPARQKAAQSRDRPNQSDSRETNHFAILTTRC